MAAYYRGRIEAFSTKIGLSIGAVMGSSSLRDELLEFRRPNGSRSCGRSLEDEMATSPSFALGSINHIVVVKLAAAINP